MRKYFSLFWGKCPRTQYLDHSGSSCLVCERFAVLVCRGAVMCHIPTSMCESPVPLTGVLTSVLLLLVPRGGGVYNEWRLGVVHICVSLWQMIINYLHKLARQRMSSSIKCPVSFAHFQIELACCFILWVLWAWRHGVLCQTHDWQMLSATWHLALFLLFTFALPEQTSHSDEGQPMTSSGLCSEVEYKNTSPGPLPQRFLLFFIAAFLEFYFLRWDHDPFRDF